MTLGWGPKGREFKSRRPDLAEARFESGLSAFRAVDSKSREALVVPLVVPNETRFLSSEPRCGPRTDGAGDQHGPENHAQTCPVKRGVSSRYGPNYPCPVALGTVGTRGTPPSANRGGPARGLVSPLRPCCTLPVKTLLLSRESRRPEVHSFRELIALELHEKDRPR